MISCEYIFGYDRSSYSQIDVVAGILKNESTIGECITWITQNECGDGDYDLKSIALTTSNTLCRCIDRIYYLELINWHMNGHSDERVDFPILYSKERICSIIEDDAIKRHIQEIPQNKTRKSL